MTDAIYAPVDTPVGEVFAAVTGEGVRLVLPSPAAEQFEVAYQQRFGFIPERVDRLAGDIEVAIAEGDPDGVQLDLRGIALFSQAVLRRTSEIEIGTTRTYRQVAESLGRPGAARAVGRALSTNPLPLLVPCHRVIAADGSLGDYAYDLPMKQALLEHEGVPIGAA